MARFATLLVGGLNLLLVGGALGLLSMRQPMPHAWGPIATLVAGTATLVALRPRSPRSLRLVCSLVAVGAHALVCLMGFVLVCEGAREQAQGDIVGGSATWMLPGLVVAIPALSVGWILASGLPSLLPRPALALLLVLPAIAVAWFASWMASYMLAAALYEGLIASPPPMQAELEGRLAPLAYRARSFDLQTSWARHRVSRPGEEIARYLVLGILPIDVVVEPAGRVLAIYSSFE